jgi:hypothetical protein
MPAGRQEWLVLLTDPPSSSPPAAQMPARLKTVRVRGFRTIIDATFQPGPVSALIGEPGTGKSNLLAALRAALDPSEVAPTPEDVARGSGATIRIDLETTDGSVVSVEGTSPAITTRRDGELPPVVYLPARLRAGAVVAAAHRPPPPAERARALIGRALPAATEQTTPGPRAGATEPAHGLVRALETWIEAGVTGMVVLIEEPELFLPPQTQRYLYRLLRHLAGSGNQVLYSTHSPAFLNVARLNELVLTERHPDLGTRLLQPDPLPSDDEFRAFSEFDSTRSELFLARAAILVEGLTERLALPFVFHALGYDPDRERISIIECGGKPNILLVGRVARAVGIPFLAVHDRDAPRGRRPNPAERRLNQLISELAGPNQIELTPDFEGIAGLRGRRRKPARAWNSFARLTAGEVPAPLGRLVERAVAMARR